MKTIRDTRRDTKSQRDNRARLSPDGKWRSFPKVPNLLQYVSTGLYFARCKVNGKLIRRGLSVKVFEDAKLALHDFLSREQKRRHVQGAPVVFSEARRLYESTVDNDPTLSPHSRRYRHYCIKRLLKSWPGLDVMKPRTINRQQCEKWASALAGEIDAQYFNNVLGSFREILLRAGISNGESPLAGIKRMGVENTPLTLPEPGQFTALINAMENSGAGQQQECADFARFLAFSGCRLSEARQATWADVDFGRGLLTVHNAKVRRARNWTPTRKVPIIPDMRKLLERLHTRWSKPDNQICKVGECEKSLARACKEIRIPKLTHHDLRHLFATRCIEAGVDIPTVSRWLGHSDGGALAMRVYGHLREQHSTAMAQKVTFSTQEGA